jgi:hypothetical protein
LLHLCVVHFYVGDHAPNAIKVNEACSEPWWGIKTTSNRH